MSAILSAHGIPDANVFMHPEGEDVALVVSVNNYPTVWTVYGPDTEWAQCDCFVGQQNTMCKHIMKCFLMKHPEVDEGLIVREAGTRCGVKRTIPLSQCFQAVSDNGTEEGSTEILSGKMPDKVESSSASLEDGTAGNPIRLDPSTRSSISNNWEEPKLKQDNPQTIFKELLSTADQHSEIQLHLVADLKHIRHKYRRMMARGLVSRDEKDIPRAFALREGDWSLKRKPGRLEHSKTSKRCRA